LLLFATKRNEREIKSSKSKQLRYHRRWTPNANRQSLGNLSSGFFGVGTEKHRREKGGGFSFSSFVVQIQVEARSSAQDRMDYQRGSRIGWDCKKGSALSIV
jgi:hypothetical protein